MITSPSDFAPIMLAFQPLLLNRTWEHAQILLIGAILAPGQRTVASILRVLGLSQEKQFQNYHRVLNRAAWDLRQGSRVLLTLLLEQFAARGPLLFGLDDTVERRWGRKIRARGIYRDPVRSSRSHFVKSSGLRWLSLMLLVRIPWAERVWALPLLTSLAPSERYYRKAKRKPKTLLDWARQQCLQLRRWLPKRKLTLVVDGTFAALEFLDQLGRQAIGCITRLRLDARLYQPAPARSSARAGRPRLIGARLPSLRQRLADSKTRWTKQLIRNWYGQRGRSIEFCSDTAVWYHGGLPPVPIRWVLIRDPQARFDPLALLSTDLTATPAKIIQAYVYRWQIEVTFEEARARLGLETQRQWSDKAIARSTPLLLSLFSLVTLLASRLRARSQLSTRQAAWYPKRLPTFSDALAAVRQHLWREFFTSRARSETKKSPALLLERLTEALCYAA